MKTQIPSVHELRKSGGKLRISHYRFVRMAPAREGAAAITRIERVTKTDKRAGRFLEILPLGGRTEVEYTPPNGLTEVRIADCNPRDAFNRRLGIRICLGRLKKDGVI